MASSCAHHPVSSRPSPSYFSQPLWAWRVWHNPLADLMVTWKWGVGVDGGRQTHAFVLPFVLRPHLVPSLRTPILGLSHGAYMASI